MTMEVSAGAAVDNAVAQIFQSELAPIGIKVNIQQMDPTYLTNNLG